MAQFQKQPVKIGDLVICISGKVMGITNYKAYKVVATHLSAPKNQRQFNYEHITQMLPGDFFIIDDDGDKMRHSLGGNCFGHVWEKLPNATKAKPKS